jgi:hypothetical protein
MRFHRNRTIAQMAVVVNKKSNLDMGVQPSKAFPPFL